MADEDVPYRVLSTRSIWLAAAALVVLGAAVATWLLLAYGDGDPKSANQLDAIKAAGTIVVGTGGAAALLLAARRQRTAEIALRQKDRDHAAAARDYELREVMAADARTDAMERRITELYTKAADQLGSDKPAVRLAGLYALQRLAQSQPGQRQTIVNLLCAYLRMLPPAEAEAAVQEQEVRLAVQRILAGHLRPTPAEDHWADIDIDLTGATLDEFDFLSCAVRSATFVRARFTGSAWFTRATFARDAQFGEARFEGTDTSFRDARFTQSATFVGARFAGNADFRRAVVGAARFIGVRFGGRADFDHARFDDGAEFADVQFLDHAGFGEVRFAAGAWFDRARFGGPASFLGCDADGRPVSFRKARFGEAVFERVKFGSVGFDNAQFDDVATFGAARFATASLKESRFAAAADFTSVAFGRRADFTGASFAGAAVFHLAALPADRTTFTGVTFARGVPREVAKYRIEPETADQRDA